MYRPRSTAVWFNLPGVVAAYQPVACPGGPLLARINVSNEQRTPGRYAAVPVVAPGFDPGYGWDFNGSTQVLATGIYPASGWSMLIKFSNNLSSGDLSLAGCEAIGDTRFKIQPRRPGDILYYMSGGYLAVSPALDGGVLGIAGQQGYRNGLPDGGTIYGRSWTNTTAALRIGGNNRNNAVYDYIQAREQAILIAMRTLSATEMALAARQMAWCHANPDWNAWGRRRRYYYAPSAAAGLAFSPIGSGVVGSSVVRRVV